jgi:cardiolipin synthase A/B
LVQLIVQPEDGIDALIKAIDRARKSLDVMIFRFDEGEVEHALTRAAERGVFVHALIAFTNRGGEEHLRKLELRLLDKGITVARTDDDLVRYHAKFMIVDGRELHLLAFNFTHLDIERSRSFGVITRDGELVREAEKLFDCDVKRRRYKAGSSRFVVSPVNARESLAEFIKGAKRELFIYDPQVSDRALIKLLVERAQAGVRIRIIGKLNDKKAVLPWRRFTRMRLHTRTILRDGDSAFVGSQSLRKLELDSRREAGVIFRDRKVVAKMRRVFEKDWNLSKSDKNAKKKAVKVPVKKTAKRVAKVISKELPVTPVVSHVVDVIRKNTNLALHPKEVEETVREAVKDALKDTVKDAAKKVVKTVVEEEL